MVCKLYIKSAIFLLNQVVWIKGGELLEVYCDFWQQAVFLVEMRSKSKRKKNLLFTNDPSELGSISSFSFLAISMCVCVFSFLGAVIRASAAIFSVSWVRGCVYVTFVIALKITHFIVILHLLLLVCSVTYYSTSRIEVWFRLAYSLPKLERI